VLGAAAAGALLLLTGCTTAEPEGATFVFPSTDVVECQEHQSVGPSDAYAGDEDSDTVAMLDLLRYWNQNGDKPYCDGEPPTATDTEWAQTVERLKGG
jgi:hypothetical protein